MLEFFLAANSFEWQNFREGILSLLRGTSSLKPLHFIVVLVFSITDHMNFFQLSLHEYAT